MIVLGSIERDNGMKWVNKMKYVQFIDNTQQAHDVVSTSATSYRRLIDVETSSCVCWACVNIYKMRKLS